MHAHYIAPPLPPPPSPADPQVFQSAAHMADTYYWYTYLQRPTDDIVNDFITDQYELLYR